MRDDGAAAAASCSLGTRTVSPRTMRHLWFTSTGARLALWYSWFILFFMEAGIRPRFARDAMAAEVTDDAGADHGRAPRHGRRRRRAIALELCLQGL